MIINTNDMKNKENIAKYLLHAKSRFNIYLPFDSSYAEFASTILLFKYSGKSVKSGPKTRDKVSLCETLGRLRVLTVHNDIHQTLFVIYTCLGTQIYGKC